MRIMALFAACWIGITAALPGFAEPLAFGGRGEDILYEAVSAEDGFFAVGSTASSDGDLDMRTRMGETGWALRVDGGGHALWSFCSGKSGMFRMTAPHVYEDGTFSLVLTDETRRRGEWIVLDSRGRQTLRVAVPAEETICPKGEEGVLLAMQPLSGDAGAHLLLLIAHEGSSALCASALFPDGGLRACGEFYGDAQGVLLPARGAALHIGAELGAIAVTRLAPGVQPETSLIALEDAETGVTRVTDALMGGDESLLMAIETVTATGQSENRLLRVNAQGETLFERRMEEGAFSLLTETDAGYAVLQGGASVLFLDEDGALLGQSPAQTGTLALLPAGEGVYALIHDAERGRRQAVFTRLMPQGEVGAWVEPPEPLPSPVPQKSAEGIAFGEGCLHCQSVIGGVTVAYVNDAGGEVWRTRIPIHTAADRLVFDAARHDPDGDILLEGYYETDLSGNVLREGVQVRLSPDGVLRGINIVQ